MSLLHNTNNFLLLCEDSDTNLVKNYYIENPNVQLESNNYEALYWFCKNNNVDLIEWFINKNGIDNIDNLNNILKILVVNKNFNIINYFYQNYKDKIDEDNLLIMSCRYNNINTFIMILKSKKIIDEDLLNKCINTFIKSNSNTDNFYILNYLLNYGISINFNLIVKTICCYENNTALKYILESIELSFTEEELNEIFNEICSCSNINILQIFIEKYNAFNFNIQEGLICSLTNENLEISEFILHNYTDIVKQIKGNNNNLTKINNIFSDEYISLETLIFIFKLFPEIDVKIGNNLFFKLCCQHNNLEYANILKNIHPESYSIVSYNNNIIRWNIIKNLEYISKTKVDIIIDCPICLEKSSDTITHCKHQFCYDCLNHIYNKYDSEFPCPICRRDIVSILKIE